ncbi:uncharacterized protein LOC111103984 [Crassostrea virginica]
MAACRSRVSFLLGLVFVHFTTVSALSWWQTLTPLQANHCPYSSEDNVCYELIKSSTNCSYICAHAHPIMLYMDPGLYSLCHDSDGNTARHAECHYYECQRKCCTGWTMDEYGKCSIERKGIDCLNGGTAMGDVCICPPYFTGENCEKAMCEEGCLNGGECRQIDKNKPPQCICAANFTGTYCEKPVCGEGCLNGGTCQSKFFGVVCLCPDGFMGPRCEQEFTTKRATCRFVHSHYDTSCAQSCRTDSDCSQEETCCEHQGRNICVVKEEKAHQFCNYDGQIPDHLLRVGQVATDVWGKRCRCMPGYYTGSLHCGDEVCGNYDLDENTCAHHGDGVMHDDDKVDYDKIEGGVTYYTPRMINCPDKYSRIMVEVQRDSNVALMYHQFRARDYLGEELQVHVSQQKFYACNCSLGTRVRANATAVDRLGGKTTCCYTVEIVDRHPPKLVHCPADIYAVAGEKISWAIPKATDNVGIRDLWLEPNVHNGSQIGSGNHVFRYVAEDWHGNKAECRFIVSVIGSGSSENGWPSDLKSRIKTDTSVVIGASVVGILAIALLVLIVVVFRVCRRARIFKRRTMRCFRSAHTASPSAQRIDDCLHEPPPYEVAAKDKLPDYKPRDDPPVYDDICKDDAQTETIGGCSNPIYTVSGSLDNIRGTAVNPNSLNTDV